MYSRPACEFRVICGATGSGKSRLLQQLAEAGAQVLDLETLACHRGSVLGGLPSQPQPGQKYFESLLWDRLRRFDTTRPVYVESESRKVGSLRVPDVLLARMRESPCVRLDVELDVRVSHTGLIAIADDGTVDFLHSTPPNVREQPILDYMEKRLAENPKKIEDGKAPFAGFKFLRLEADPLGNLRAIDGPDAPKAVISAVTP